MAQFQSTLQLASIPAIAVGMGFALRELIRVVGEVFITRRALEGSDPKERAAILRALGTTFAGRRD